MTEGESRGRVSAHLIANNEAREKFVLSEAGLLMTAKALDREERDTYMVTIVLGRKGILRGKQAIQVKVSSDTSQLSMHLSQKFNHTNDGILLPRSMLLTKMTIVLPSNSMFTRVTFRKTLMSEPK